MSAIVIVVGRASARHFGLCPLRVSPPGMDASHLVPARKPDLQFLKIR